MKDELIQARRDQDLSQSAVAELLGISPQAIQKFERYDNDPKLSTLRRYANAVGVIIEHRVTTDVGQSEFMAAQTAWTGSSKTVRDTMTLPGGLASPWQVANSKRHSFALAS